MITGSVPTSWQNLQEETGKVLRQCGFNVEIEKTVTTARGNVEIDVFAEEEVKGRKYTIVCECKYWKSRIPQNVIHGLRTVINDLGANIGYIITTSDFQSGAIDASSFTNIELLNWKNFQDRFFESWYDNYFVPTITEELDPIFTYSEPILPKWFPKMSEKDKERFLKLKEKYDVFGWTMMSFSSYCRMLDREKTPTLPLRERLNFTEHTCGKIPDDILDECHYNEFLEKAISFGENAIAEFREFRDEYSEGQNNE